MLDILLFINLLLGQLGRIQLTPTIALYLHDVVIGTYILFRIPSLWKSRKTVSSMVLKTPFILVSLVFLISLVVNIYRFSQPELLVGVSYFLRFVMYAVLYFIVRTDNKSVWYWTRWVMSLGIGFAGLGIMQLFLYPDLRNLSLDGWDPHYFRLFSTLLDPNFMGMVLIVSFLSGIVTINKMKTRMWGVLGLLIIFIAFLLTYSRSSYVAAIGGFIAYIVLTKKWKIALWLVVFCLTLAFLPTIGGESSMLFRQVTAFARITNWQEGMQYFFQSPVIGFGFNMVKALPHNAPTLEVGAIARSTGGYDNSIVFVLVTTGLIGLAACTFLWSKMVGIGITLLKNTKTIQLGTLYVVLLVAFFIHSMFLNTLFYPQLMILLWVLTGAVEKEANK
jgi:O-antigen ligase